MHNESSSPLHVGIFASLKKGFEQFIYREVTLLERLGMRISVYPTKFGDGLYPPRASWNVQHWTFFSLISANLMQLFVNSGKYVPLSWEAFRTKSWVDFAVAVDFSLRMSEVDVLYATFGDRKLFVAYYCKRLTGKPLICTFHAYEIYQNPNPNLLPNALAACDQIITVSQYNVQQLKDRYKIPPEKIEIVRYAIDLTEHRPQKKFKILIVGFFVERKGHDVLFQAIKKLDRNDFEVWVVGGEGAEEGAVDVPGLASKLGIEAQVCFFGKQSGPTLKALYHACDVFCLPCHFEKSGVGEGFPNVIIEAMACGKPVISTRHVEIPKVLKRVLVDEHDVDGLADALLKVYQSPEWRDELGAEARQTAEEHFSAANVEKTMRIMQRVTEKQ